MKRVLFVDDDDHILAALRDVMRRQRTRWDMAFTSGVEAALEACRARPFDVVVTDLHMPGADGAYLLEEIQRVYPDTVRIVLSGSTDPGAALPTVKAAHRYLAKPCDPETLEAAIERTLSLRSLISDERVRAIVGRIGSLPSQPAVIAALLEKLQDPDVSAAEIAAVLEGDMAMCAKLLQISNSAFFGLPRRVTNVADAVKYLGHGLIRDLVLATSVFGAEDSRRPEWTSGLQQHALLTGAIARHITGGRAGDGAFMAGLLHDVGILILATRLPDEFERLLDSLNERPRTLRQAEIDLESVGHGEMGAYLLSLWGLPQTMVEAVAFHDRPAEVVELGFELTGAVYVADHLAQEIETQACGLPGVQPQPMDPDCLAGLGVADSLPGWRAEAKSLVFARTA